MSAAGEKFAVSERYYGDFTLQNERRSRKKSSQRDLLGRLRRGAYVSERLLCNAT